MQLIDGQRFFRRRISSGFSPASASPLVWSPGRSGYVAVEGTFIKGHSPAFKLETGDLQAAGRTLTDLRGHRRSAHLVRSRHA